MGVSESKKYTKSTASNEIQLDFNKGIQSELKIITNWSFDEIREVCLAYKRYSYESPYLSRFTFKKLLSESDRISQEIFEHWTQGDKYVSFYEFVCALVLTSFNTFKRKLQFLYMVFNFQHTQSIKLKNYLLMYQCMVFAYCRLTKQEFPPFKAIKKYLYEEYLTSESMEVLEGVFEFRRLLEEVEINQVTRELFMRFEGNVLTAKEKPTTLMLNGLAKYDKQQSERIFRIIKNVYEDKNYEEIDENEIRKKERLETRRLSVLNQVEEDKIKFFEKTKDFRIKNRSYSLKQFDGYGTKIIYNGPMNNEKSFNNFHSTTSVVFSKSKARNEFSSTKSIHLKSPSVNKIATLPISEQKVKELTDKKLTNVKLQSLSENKPKNVIFLGGKAYTKSDFFETIEYFNSLSNNKDEIRIKEFFKTFENKTFLKRQLYSLFKFFDKNLNGEISFEEFIKRTYPNIDKKFLERLKEWNIDYKNIYQADKILIKKEKKETKIELPEDAKLRIQEIFLSFGGEKGYLSFEDIRTAYKTGFSMQECENVMKEFGIDGKIYIEGFGRMMLPLGYVIENCDWHLVKTERPQILRNSSFGSE